MRTRFLIALPLLGLAVTTATTPARAATKPSPVPVVVTSFSNLHPKVGQHETVYVQFFAGKRDVSGARLQASVQVGTHTVVHLTGTRTDRHGKAWTRFVVPRSARGRHLQVVTRLTYKGRFYTGNNSIAVSK